MNLILSNSCVKNVERIYEHVKSYWINNIVLLQLDASCQER